LQFASKLLGSMALLAVAAGISARPSYAAPMRQVTCCSAAPPLPVAFILSSRCIYYAFRTATPS
jgi:hypothetical protein